MKSEDEGYLKNIKDTYTLIPITSVQDLNKNFFSNL